MASNARYQPAAQHDPDTFPQAPPAYADESQRLFAAVPRDSHDNLPDDFKVSSLPCSPRKMRLTLILHPQFGGSVAEATVDIRNQFIRKVYTILTLQLLVTAAVSSLSFFSDTYRNWIQSHPGLVWASVSPTRYSPPSNHTPCASLTDLFLFQP